MEKNIERLKSLQQALDWLEPAQPASPMELEELERTLEVRIHSELRTLLLSVGYTYIGIELMSDMAAQTMLYRQLMQEPPRAEILRQGIRISDDGSGNPIVLGENGKLYILYHDDDGFEELDDTLASLLAGHVEYLETLLD